MRGSSWKFWVGCKGGVCTAGWGGESPWRSWVGCRGRGDAQLEEVRVPLEVLGGVQELGGVHNWRRLGVPVEVLGGVQG